MPKIAVWLGKQFRKLRFFVREIKSEVGWNDFEKELNDTKSDIDHEIKQLEKISPLELESKGETKN